MKFLVYDIENHDCMTNQCKICQRDFKELRKIVKEGLMNYDEEEFVQFSQWTTTGCSTLVIQEETVEDYVDLVVSNLDKLTMH